MIIDTGRRCAILAALCIVAVFTLLSGVYSNAQAAVPEVKISYRYAINLASYHEPVDPSALPRLELFENFRLYTTQHKEKGKTWYRLRAGFFPSKAAAEQALKSVKKDFPEAWVTIVSLAEREASARLAIETSPVKAKKDTAPKGVPLLKEPKTVTLAPVSEQDLARLMARSESAGLGSEKIATVDLANGYVINLASYEEPVDPASLPRLSIFEKYRLYAIGHKEKGRTWYRLRIGFFPTKRAARAELVNIRKTFPEAWVTYVPKAERESSWRNLVILPARQPAAEGVKISKTPAGAEKLSLPPVTEQRLDKLMEEAEELMTNKEYPRAVQIYTKVLLYPGYKDSAKAQELLALARERNGQFAHARAEYREYLRQYPEGEGSDRVRQRLAGLETATAKPKEKLREVKEKKEEVEVYGSFSQFYNRDESFTDLGGNVVNRSSLSSDLDLTVRRRDAKHDVRAVLTGGYDHDFLNDGKDSETRLSRLYLDALDRRTRLSARIGRQSRSTGGVLGRFDGALLSYQMLSQVNINAVSGFPVDSSVLQSIDTSKYFYGVSVDLGTFAGHWDLNTFYIKQDVDGITDREATGGEVRYFDSKRSFFTLVDYDVSYSDFNTVLFVGNLMLEDNTVINIVVDYRKTPVLTTSNALIGQAATSVNQLLDTMSEEEVRQLAIDRTAENKSISLGVTHPLNKKLQVSGDFTVSELTGTPATGGVEATDGTGYEYIYNAQLIGSSLLKEGDIAILGLSLANASTTDTLSFNVNTRYPINHEWRINPRFRADYRFNTEGGDDQLLLRPSLRMDYYWRRRVSLEFEAGGEWSYIWSGNQTDKSRDYFVSIGYRIDL